MAIPVIGDIIAAVAKPLDKLILDKDLRQKLEHEITMQLATLNLAQVAVNKQEAAHKSIFVAGWRPFIGWVCGAALAWEFIGLPVGNWALTLAGLELTYSMPEVASGRLMELVLAMLGMAGLRTYEKRTGCAREK